MGDTCVTCIDVGRGDCILIQAGGAAALIDTGYDKTSERVLAYLKARGVARLEYLVITHYDRDHVGGFRDIGKAIGVDVVYLPGYKGSDKNYRTLVEAIGELRLPARAVTEVLRLKLGDAALDVFPSRVTYVSGSCREEGNDNDVSLVASLTSGNDSYLFAGDLEADGIAAYLKAGHGQFDVLKMPHHGQKSSYTDELLEDVRPKITVITDSVDEPADKKTLRLLNEVGSDVYRTSLSGTISVRSCGAGSYSVSMG